jgi:hypothetical protein
LARVGTGRYVKPEVTLTLGRGRDKSLRKPRIDEYGLPTIDDLRGHLPFLGDYVCVFYSGSHAVGWNHHRSDLDLYVVTAEPVVIDREAAQPLDVWHVDVDANPPKVGLFLGILGPYRSDIEFWLETQFDQILDKMPAGDEVTDDILNFSYADRDLLNKLAIGHALDGAEWLQERQRKLAAGRVGRAVAIGAMAVSHAQLEDTAGFLSSGDLESAFLAVTMAFDLAIDAVLSVTGDLTPQAKWSARRFKRVNPSLISFERYWSLQTRETYTQENAPQWIEDAARSTHNLLIGLTQELDA